MLLVELSPFQYGFAFFAFFLGGLVKGTIGIGMKAIILGLIATVIELPVAIALLIVPGIAANAWQVFSEPGLLNTIKRIWTVLLACCIGVWIGAGVLVVVDTRLLTIGLGVLLTLFASYALLTPQIPSPGRHEHWMSPVFGGLNGLAAGMTGSDVIPGVPYLQSLGLKRDRLVQAMGLLFLTASLAITLAFQQKGLLSQELAVSSVMFTIPALIGYYIGAKVRQSIPEDRFRLFLLYSLLLLGLYIVIRKIL